MKQKVSNSEKNWIEYFYKVQQVAKILKSTCSNKCKCLEEKMLDLNISKKKIKIFKKFKLH